MNEKLQEAVTLLINKAISGAEQGVAFLEGQLPDYIMQLLMWHGWYNFVLFICGVTIALLAILLDIKAFKAVSKNRDSDDVFLGWGIFGSIIRLPVFAVCIGLLNLAWLKIWIAPKVWLVEYAANLVK